VVSIVGHTPFWFREVVGWKAACYYCAVTMMVGSIPRSDLVVALPLNVRPSWKAF
jgi:hypothetical protein